MILVCSFYSLPGMTMANGHPYRPTAFTVASKTLPLGWKLAVCRGRACAVVTVTDRGPFVPGRSLDLSVAAFRCLAPLRKGLIKARVRRASDRDSTGCVILRRQKSLIVPE
jgi:rare lipoprotein A